MKKRNSSAKKKIHNFYLNKLKNQRIKKIYSEFEKNLEKFNLSKFGIAVSGGADSMALTFLAKCHSIKKNKGYLYFTVDHNIRSTSRNEATQTKKQLKKFGINCDILTWKKNKSFSNLQAKARENRYKLIFKKCLKNKINIVLTAHHKDDLYENFFIRLLRGSGLKGLGSFKSSKTKINKNLNVYIVRPLLNISKKDLSFITRNTFNFYVKDYSNENDNFLRIKVRKLINKLEQFGLTFEKFKLTLENLNKSNESIEFYVKKNLDENTNFLNKKTSIIIKENFFNQPEEVSFRSLSRLIHNFGNKKNFTRGKKILSLHNDIKSNQDFKKKTLSGCIIEKVNKSIIISKEI